MKKIVIVITLIVLQSTFALSQNNKYKVGETVQDFPLGRILNYEKNSSTFNEVKRKLTIIDFWGTWCGPCVASVPKITQLQEKFRDKVQFLLVSNEDELRLSRFIEARPSFKLPIIIDADEAIFKMFQPAGYPRYVLIDESHKVLAITDSDNINEANIEAFLAGKDLNLPILEEKPFDISRPLSGNDNLTYQSVFRPYLQGVGAMSNVTFPKSIYENRRILVTNLTIQVLLQIAYQSPYTRTVVELKDASITKFDNKSNLYCYDLIVPEALGEKRFQMMQDDIARYFSNIKAKVEARPTKVYLLGILSKEKLSQVKTKSGKADKVTSWTHFAVYNQSLTEIGNALENFVGKPVIFESKNDFNLDFEFDTKMSDISEIRKELNKVGLDLIEAERPVKMLVISD